MPPRPPAPIFEHELNRDAINPHLAREIDAAWTRVLQTSIALSNAAAMLSSDLERHTARGHGINTFTGSGSLANHAAKAQTALTEYQTLGNAAAMTSGPGAFKRQG